MSDISILPPSPGQSIPGSEINDSPYQPPGNIWDNSGPDTPPPTPPAGGGGESEGEGVTRKR